jgi:hypothetical protein
MTNKLQYTGYNLLMDEIRMAWDGGDPYASGAEWRFAIAEVIYFDLGFDVEGYEPHGVTEPDPASYAVDTVRYCVENGADLADLECVFEVLNRHRDWVRAAGRDY